MAQKKGSRPIWVAGAIHVQLEDYLRSIGWTWGKTKYVERLIELECAGELHRLGERDTKRRQVAEKFLFGPAGPSSVEGEDAEPHRQRQSGK